MVLVSAGCSCQDWYVHRCGLRYSEHAAKALQEIWKERVDFLGVTVYILFFYMPHLLCFVNILESARIFIASTNRHILCPGRVRSIAISLHVCVSVCPQAYFWNRWTVLHKIMCADPL